MRAGFALAHCHHSSGWYIASRLLVFGMRFAALLRILNDVGDNDDVDDADKNIFAVFVNDDGCDSYGDDDEDGDVDDDEEEEDWEEVHMS